MQGIHREIFKYSLCQGLIFREFQRFWILKQPFGGIESLTILKISCLNGVT